MKISSQKWIKTAGVLCLVILVVGGPVLVWWHSRQAKAQEYFSEALKAGHSGQADRAMTLLYSATAVDPFFSPAYSLLGWYQFQRKEWRRAERLLLKAVRCSPRNKKDWSLLAEVYYRQGNLREFLSAITTANRIDSRYIKPYLQRAMMHYDLHLYELALSDVSRALELDPQNAAALELKGMIARAVAGGGQESRKDMKYFRIQE